jgi:hypothetical protein
MTSHELIQWGGGALVVAGAGSRQGAMAAHWRWVAWWLRCSICYEISSYGFGMMWGTHFTNLGQRRRDTPSGQWWCSLFWLGWQSGTPSTPLWFDQDHDDFLMTSSSVSRQWINSGGDEFLFSKDFRVLGLRLILGKIWANRSTIHRGSYTESYASKILTTS